MANYGYKLRILSSLRLVKRTSSIAIKKRIENLINIYIDLKKIAKLV